MITCSGQSSTESAKPLLSRSSNGSALILGGGKQRCQVSRRRAMARGTHPLPSVTLSRASSSSGSLARGSFPRAWRSRIEGVKSCRGVAMKMTLCALADDLVLYGLNGGGFSLDHSDVVSALARSPQ